MKSSESIASFLQSHGHADEDLTSRRTAAKPGHFHVYDVEQFCRQALALNRRNFYKISLLLGVGQLHYANRSVQLDRPALVFSNPLVPYAWEGDLSGQSGYFCLFSEDFLSVNERSNPGLQESPLFKIGSDPVFFLNEAQLGTVRRLFQHLLAEQESAYPHKHELLRTYVQLLLHEALKMQPQTAYYSSQNAAGRLVSLFRELLDSQFPVEGPSQPLRLRVPGDFAACLSVHVNHLNRAVRSLTGKTTSAHIAERFVDEAKALLRHTTWPVADIAYSLGFDHPTYFTRFFKKQAGLTPSALRP